MSTVLATKASGGIAEGTDAVLEVQGLRTSFQRDGGWTEIVRGVDLRLDRGRTLAILGESGSGKSVTARSILGLYGARARITGSVVLNGAEIVGAPSARIHALRGATMSMVPQDPNGSLDPLRRVRTQLRDMIRADKPRARRAEIAARVQELLELVGIRDSGRVADAYPNELSGGMRQRIAIALAVSRDPLLLIADEPTTALDPTVQKQILELFDALQQRMGTAMIFVTHDVGVARAITDDVAVMYAGRFVEYGPASQVLTEPQHAYTRALLAAIPTADSVRGRLPTVADTLTAEGIDPRDWSIE